MAKGFLIESLLGGPTVSTTTSGNHSAGDKKDDVGVLICTYFMTKTRRKYII